MGKNPLKAAELYQRTATQGHAEAQHTLAICYATGCGVSKDMSHAVEWFHSAADQLHAAAQFNLAMH